LKDWLKGRPPEKRCEPFWWHDLKWNNPLAPVVGVSWFEAEAYCNWLTEQFKVSGSKFQVWRNNQLETLNIEPANITFRLPTGEEWERAARHTDGRAYPWGNTFDRNRLSCEEFWKPEGTWHKIGSTTVVGQFPEGNSPAGTSDQSGNVWEWTNSWYEDKKVNRVVRGGSWDGSSVTARCAVRYRNVPDLFLDNIGFRVCSPGSIPAS